MIGISVFLRISLQTSSPSIPGSVRSKITRLKFSKFNLESPKNGSSATVISISYCCRYSLKISASSKSSSIIKILVIKNL